MGRGLWIVATAIAALAQSVAAYMFEVDGNTITQCGQTYVQWTNGAQPPLSFTVFANYSTAQVIDVPASAVNSDGSGSYTFQLPYAGGNIISFIMSDNTGWGTGGASVLYNVGAAYGGASCTLVNPTPKWTFSDDRGGSIPQCGQQTFTWDAAVATPLEFKAVIPGGQIIAFNSSNKATSVDMTPGTELMIGAWDSAGVNGGITQIITIGNGNGNCMNGNSPSSTPVQQWPSTAVGSLSAVQTGASQVIVTLTVQRTANPTEAAGSSGNKNKTTISTGAIAGIAVAGAALVAIAGVLLWLLRRRKNKDHRSHAPGPVDLFESGDAYVERPLMHHREDGRTSPTIRPFMGGRTAAPPVTPMPMPMPHGGGGGLGSSAGDSSHGGGMYAPMNPAVGPGVAGMSAAAAAYVYPEENRGALPPGAGYDDFGGTGPSGSASGSGGGHYDGYNPRNTVVGSSSMYSSGPPESVAGTSSAGSAVPLTRGQPAPASVAPSSQSGGTTSSAGLAKQREAMGLSNPDQPGGSDSGSGSAQLFDAEQPRQSAPTGGFRQHQDVGELLPTPQEDVEDLPPTYNPEWQDRKQQQQ